MVVVAPYADAITCGQVTSSVVPCFGYLSKGGPMPPACCRGVVGLNNAAKTTADRQTVCRCVKGIFVSTPGINLGNAASIPSKCGVNIPFKIEPTVDCNNGVVGLNDAAKTPAGRQATCGCLKSVYASNSGINPSNAASLPGKCGLNIPYKNSPNTDCSKYVKICI
ncbi:hypothetical protein OSB04_023043 [Centaurea solstitialis]|uniref:Non-specific lipid-transfer protein n=1 Tax=Centaurea solstitialis TaxID=347529 RepID=A0AA38WCI3_9ASTR|nr:hypothetical protein OSB04_023043 [Centaurea solstitialis]